MGSAYGGQAVGLVPTQETIERAFELADGQPRTVGELAFKVCEVLGVDTTGCDAYGLRKVFPYQAYVTLLKRMVRDGDVVVHTRREWRELSRGVFFRDGNPATQAYATADAARQIRAALRAAGASDPRARWELALHMARQRVLREHADLVQRYASAWMEEDQAKQGGGGGG
jgi:hypothetical protein